MFMRLRNEIRVTDPSPASIAPVGATTTPNRISRRSPFPIFRPKIVNYETILTYSDAIGLCYNFCDWVPFGLSRAPPWENSNFMEVATNMKKVLTLLFTLGLAISLGMPVFAATAAPGQDQGQTQTTTKKHKKHHHSKKHSKSKSNTAPTQ